MNASEIIQTIYTGLHIFLTVLALSVGAAGAVIFIREMLKDTTRRHTGYHPAYNSDNFSVFDE